jgi:RNA polymerase sigma-54 factor
MEIKQQLRQSQQLVMTPQLQQAIKLLQMSRMELVDMVREELMENPVLEDQAEIGEVSPRVAEVPQPAQQEARSIEQAVALDDRASEKSVAGEEKKVEEIDWERYLENHAMQAPLPSSGRMSDEDLPGVEATLSKREDLAEHIAWQVRLSDLTENELAFAALVVGNLDENGYLKLEDVAARRRSSRGWPRKRSWCPRTPRRCSRSSSAWTRWAWRARDPCGECLMSAGGGLRELDSSRASRCSRSTCRTSRSGTTRPSPSDLARWRSRMIYDVAQAIGELEPRPGRDYVTAGEPQLHRRRTCTCSKVGDKYYVVSANDDGMPRLKISGFYRSGHGRCNADGEGVHPERSCARRSG